MGGKTSYESRIKYEKKVYERTSLVLKKEEGGIKVVKEAAEKLGLSTNEFIKQAIFEKIAREKEKAAQ